MMKWIVLAGIAAMATLGVALPKTMATLPVDGVSQPAQASFARAAARRCGKRGASRSCRSAARRTPKRSAHTNLLPPNLMIGIGF
jgi:uncharacterized membrane protein